MYQDTMVTKLRTIVRYVKREQITLSKPARNTFMRFSKKFL
jgi:hypothetical protein